MIETLATQFIGSVHKWALDMALILVTVFLLYVFGYKIVRWIEEKRSEANANKSPHEDCKYVCDHRIFVIASDEYHSYRNSYKNDLLREQMVFAENQIDLIVKQLKDNYVEVAKKHHPEGCSVLDLGEYKKYCLCLRIFREELKTMGRAHFRLNGFAEKEPEEWVRYCNDKSDIMLQRGIEILDQYYSDILVPRDAVKAGNIGYIPMIKRLIADCYDNARELAIDSKKTLEKYEAAYYAAKEKFGKGA